MRESRTPCNAAAFHRTTTLSLALVWPSTPSGQIRTARVSKHRKYMGRLDVNVDGRGILAAIGILPPAILDHRIYANHLFSPRVGSRHGEPGIGPRSPWNVIYPPLSAEGLERIKRRKRRCVRGRSRRS